MEQFLLITLLLNFDGTVVDGDRENGFPPKVLVSEAECKYLKYQTEFMGPPVCLKYLSAAYICERKQLIVASGYNAETTELALVQPRRGLRHR